MDAVDILCAQLTRDLFAIAKFLLKMATRVLVQSKYAIWLQVDLTGSSNRGMSMDY